MKNREFLKGAIPYVLIGGVLGLVLGLLKVSDINFNFEVDYLIKLLGYILFILSLFLFLFGLISTLNIKKYVFSKNIDFECTEKKLCFIEVFISLSMILLFISFGLLSCYKIVDFSKPFTPFMFFYWIVFLIICFGGSYIQHLVVEYVKKINPEKKGNALDSNFLGKWYESFDEAEKYIVGQVCYNTYIVTTKIFSFLLIISMFLSVLININVTIILTLGFVNIINIITYYYFTFKYNKTVK